MKSFQTVNPATDEVIETYHMMDEAKAIGKVEATHAAYLEWRKKSFQERGDHLRAIAKALRENADELAALMTNEMGKLLRDGHMEVEACAAIMEYSAEQGPKVLGDEERKYEGGKKRGIVSHTPIGVIYSIQPWNFPLYQPVRVLAANLMAGNGVLLKHATICTGSGLALLDICRKAGLPEGIFDVLIIDHDLSDKIVEHKLIRGVTLTGSDGAGRYVGGIAGKNIKKTVLELGSNDAYLVLEDADVDLAVKISVMGRIFNNGETCVCAKRFIVTEKVYDKFLEGFVEGMKSIKLGDPNHDDTQLGPVSSKDQFDTLLEQVQKSVEGGAELLCGGDPKEGKGQYFPATVLANCKPGTPAYEDEIFGPVAAVIKAKDDEDAMRIANESRYGLGGGIFSRDEEKAIRLARDHFDTGMVRINSFGAADPNMPFGGVKDSGFGREHGGFGMREFTNAKSIYLP